MQWPSTRELNGMTLQVGIVGSDGIVLASDRLLQVFEHGSRSVMRSSKFLRGAGVLCCYSGDSIAEQTANAIQAHDWAAVPNDMEEIRSGFKQIGNSAYRKEEVRYGLLPNAIRKVLTVFRDHLWRSAVKIPPSPTGSSIERSPATSKTPAGTS